MENLGKGIGGGEKCGQEEVVLGSTDEPTSGGVYEKGNTGKRQGR